MQNIKLEKFLVIAGIVLLTAVCGPSHRNMYVLADKALVPEGIAWSESKNAFYLSSYARSKIIKVDKQTGVQEDFIDEGEYGFMPGVGILADDTRNILYALCGYYRLEGSRTSLFIFDINSGELIKRFGISDTGQHFMNDLIMDQKGNIFITDTKASAVYILKNGEDSLHLFMASDEIAYPNGIAISDDNTKLYVASSTKGVRVVNIESKHILNEADTCSISSGIDGLEFFRGDLYAVQNGVRANGFNFRMLELNESEDDIVAFRILDSNNPDLDIPLTFCIAGNKGIVIGNSNLQFLNQLDFTFSYPDSLKNTKLLIYDLI